MGGTNPRCCCRPGGVVHAVQIFVPAGRRSIKQRCIDDGRIIVRFACMFTLAQFVTVFLNRRIKNCVQALSRANAEANVMVAGLADPAENSFLVGDEACDDGHGMAVIIMHGAVLANDINAITKAGFLDEVSRAGTCRRVIIHACHFAACLLMQENGRHREGASTHKAN